MSDSRSSTIVTPRLRRGRLSPPAATPASPAPRHPASALIRAPPADACDAGSGSPRGGSRSGRPPGRGRRRWQRRRRSSNAPAGRTNCPRPSQGQALLHRAETAAALRRGRELHFAGIVNRQHMQPSAGGTGLRAPGGDDLCRGYLLIAEEPAGSEFTAAVATQPFEAYRFAREHLFEDHAPLWSQRASPNVPSDMSMAAPGCPLPRYTEADPPRVGQITFRFPDYLCACPSAKAGMTHLQRLFRSGCDCSSPDQGCAWKVGLCQPRPETRRVGRKAQPRRRERESLTCLGLQRR
jgi:hypothetical protein